MSSSSDPIDAGAACPSCGSPERAPASVSLEATSGSVAVFADGLHVLRCPRGHDDLSPEVVARARRATAETLPIARRRRARTDACTDCGAPLTMPVRRTVRVVTVDPPGAPIATLHFDLPMQRCGNCGLDQLPTRSGKDLQGALTAVASLVRGRDPR